ncbi:hypothetical protein KAT92_04840, partial [Candidatus Babeliales bacterium]|nr:hypothetical protein [Candidatus Babeliales bacterium]
MASFKRQVIGIKKLEEVLKSVNGLNVQVGWFSGARYQNGKPVARAAATQEYGSAIDNIPPRSFMRTTITEKKDEWAKLVKSGSKAMVAGNASARMVLEGLGLAASGDIKKKITQINSPALSPGTIANRKRK